MLDPEMPRAAHRNGGDPQTNELGRLAESNTSFDPIGQARPLRAWCSREITRAGKVLGRVNQQNLSFYGVDPQGSVHGPYSVFVDAAEALIDENLCRVELSPAQRAAVMSRRKQIYLALYPQTAQHVAGAVATNSRQVAASEKFSLAATPSFAKATAEATGITKRAVRLDAKRGEALGEYTLNQITGTSLDKGVPHPPRTYGFSARDFSFRKPLSKKELRTAAAAKAARRGGQ